ncbi:hypothetical protein MMC07_003595 [Pseudocyphellaria aurata]|nr:hypothetical protein [Pseudocyphellaria aurata]
MPYTPIVSSQSPPNGLDHVISEAPQNSSPDIGNLFATTDLADQQESYTSDLTGALPKSTKTDISLNINPETDQIMNVNSFINDFKQGVAALSLQNSRFCTWRFSPDKTGFYSKTCEPWRESLNLQDYQNAYSEHRPTIGIGRGENDNIMFVISLCDPNVDPTKKFSCGKYGSYLSSLYFDTLKPLIDGTFPYITFKMIE